MRMFLILLGCIVFGMLVLKVTMTSSQPKPVYTPSEKKPEVLTVFGTDETVPFEALHEKGGMVIYLDPLHKGFCSCWITDMGERLQQSFPDKQIATVLAVQNQEHASELARSYEGYLMGTLYLDKEGIVEKRFMPRIASVLFLTRQGGLHAMIPMEVPYKEVRKTLHRLVGAL